MSASQETNTRRYQTPGVYNLRDTGGYTAGSGSSRWRRLFRSDALNQLDDDGRALIEDLGIVHIIDLRGGEELRAAPNSLEGLNVSVHQHPIFDDASPIAQLDIDVSLSSIYDHMVDERGANLAAAIRAILEAADDEAVLVHCTAGKDRTGLVVALALSAAGVDRTEVLSDYAQSAENLRGAWVEAMLAQYGAAEGVPSPEVIEVVSASPAPVLSALLERIDREYGSVAAYLRAQGMTAAELERLSALLVG